MLEGQPEHRSQSIFSPSSPENIEVLAADLCMHDRVGLDIYRVASNIGSTVIL